MRHFYAAMTLIAASLAALPALAQPPADRGDDGNRPRRQARERILRAFDKDGDGRLNDQERGAMREQMGERFEAMRERMRELFDQPGDERAERERDRDRRRPDGDRGPEARRGPDADRDRNRDRERDVEARREPRALRRPGAAGDRRAERRPGPDRRRGPIGPMGGPPERNLQALFPWFDRDGDNVLSRREFAELSQFVERLRPGRPGGPPDGPRFGRRGFDGPPRDRGARMREGDERRGPEERQRRADQQRPRRGDPPRPPRPANPPVPPESPDNPSDAV